LRHDIPRISARVLSARLRELESKGVVTRHVLDSSPPSAEYRLSELGEELVPAIKAIVAVGMKLKDGRADCPVTERSLQTGSGAAAAPAAAFAQ
jgi:DNA-binding HxlR family transcriptional regulator